MAEHDNQNNGVPPTMASVLWATFSRSRNKIQKDNEKKKDDDGLPQCPICLENLQLEKTESFACQHTFHRKCLEQWFTYERTCPLCRKMVLFKDEFPDLT